MWTELLVLTTKDRAALPVAVRNLLAIEGAERWLADLNEPGVARLLPMSQAGGLLERVRSTGLSGDLALAAMDRFQVVAMAADGRLTLSASLLAHLDALDTGAVRIVVKDRTLFLRSEVDWVAQRSERSAKLDAALS